MGLFKKETPPQLPPQPQAGRAKPFRFELGWRGMFGLVVVCFCLFLWMFLLGIWAGQTILLPTKESRFGQAAGMAKKASAKTGAEGNAPKEQQRSIGP